LLLPAHVPAPITPVPVRTLACWPLWNQLFAKSVGVRSPTMKLSLKATRFVIVALEHYQKYHDERLQQEGLPEDDASDLANDRQYLEAIKQEFQEYHDTLGPKREGVQTEG
jgi:hypothetical protein